MNSPQWFRDSAGELSISVGSRRAVVYYVRPVSHLENGTYGFQVWDTNDETYQYSGARYDTESDARKCVETYYLG